jgi:hypothetical protein
MTEHDEKMEELIRRTMAPADTGLNRDLWPGMLRRMEERSAAVPWFDWALLAVFLAWFLFTPGAIPVFMFHL